jgi:uncharacterized protein YjbI with pentapeptide repeats
MLVSSRLGGSVLDEANLSGASLRQASLFGSYLNGADLGGADFEDANLQGATLNKADLRGANFDAVRNLDKAGFSAETRCDHLTVWPEGFNLETNIQGKSD